MNKYKVLTLLYVFIINGYSILIDNTLLWIAPALLLSIIIYLRAKDPILLLAAPISISLITILIVSHALGSSYLILIPPLIILSIESCILDNTNLEVTGLMIGSLRDTSIYLLTISTIVLILSILSHVLLVFPATISLYLITKKILYGRRVRGIKIKNNSRYIVIRGNRSIYKLSIVNESGMDWWLNIRDSMVEAYNVRVRPGRLLIRAGGLYESTMYIEGILIGSYETSIDVYIMDKYGFFTFRRRINYRLIVKPKLAASLALARELLEAFGGRGELEAPTYIESRNVKGRSGIFFGVREFIQGDESRRIHFKKSVEHQELVVKEYEAAGPEALIILVDVSVSTPEDMDDVLDKAVNLLINFFMLGLNDIGIIVYDSNRIMLSTPPTSPLVSLRMLISRLGEIEPEKSRYSFILDEPDIESLTRSRYKWAGIELEFLRRRLSSTILNEVIERVVAMNPYPARVVIITRNSRFKHLYPLFRYSLELAGMREARELINI